MGDASFLVEIEHSAPSVADTMVCAFDSAAHVFHRTVAILDELLRLSCGGVPQQGIA
jgi:hypothetical protein